ncbi:extracellular solute-binding protein [Oceanispirochaeta sp. M1]|nr:extracellular solute-binding protein [Oceanispirochaeta sp. M1]
MKYKEIYFMKKLCLIVLGLSLISTMIFANGSQESTDAKPAKDVEITVLATWAGDTPSVVVTRDAVLGFSELENGITVNADFVYEEKSYYDKLRTRIATGEFPDIFEDYGGARDKDYVESGLLVDLQPYLDADPEWRDSFVNVLGDWQYDGFPGQFGVPTDMYCVGIYYNTAIFEELNLEIPESMDEFTAVCDKLITAGYDPMSLGEKDPYRAGHFLNNLVMKSIGAQGVMDLGSRKIAYDGPEMMRLYQLIYDFNEKGYFGPNTINKDAGMARADFHNKVSAMHFDGTWAISPIDESKISADVGFFPFPYLEKEFYGHWQGGNNGGVSVVNTQDQDKIDAAVELVKMLTSPKLMAEKQAAAKGGVYPVMFEGDSSVVSPLATIVSEKMTMSEVFKTDIQNYDVNTKMLDAVRNALQGLFVGGTPEECAADIMRVVNAE